ncbi:hypothetical protein Hanom_Chr13g01203511 [Helianthus anomalus]
MIPDGVMESFKANVEVEKKQKCTKRLKRIMKEKNTSSNLCKKILTASNNVKAIMRRVMKQLRVGDQDE